MNLLLIIGIVFVALWVLGLVSAYTLGGFIYVALVVGLALAAISFVMRLRLRK